MHATEGSFREVCVLNVNVKKKTKKQPESWQSIFSDSQRSIWVTQTAESNISFNFGTYIYAVQTVDFTAIF